MRTAGQNQKPKQDNTHRPSAHAQGYDRNWRRLRVMVLREEPICRVCQHEPSTQVDHITAKTKGGTNDRDNLRGICASCHSRKTVKEDGGLRKTYRTTNFLN